MREFTRRLSVTKNSGIPAALRALLLLLIPRPLPRRREKLDF